MSTSIDLISLRGFQAASIALSAMLAGVNVSLSVCSVPPLQMSNVPAAIAAQQWAKLYDLGKGMAIPVALSGALLNAYVLYRATYSWPATLATVPSALYLGASIVAQVAIVPFTNLVMARGTNKRLKGYAEQARQGKLESETDEKILRDELETWKDFNGFRAIFPALGAVLGFVAALGNSRLLAAPVQILLLAYALSITPAERKRLERGLCSYHSNARYLLRQPAARLAAHQIISDPFSWPLSAFENASVTKAKNIKAKITKAKAKKVKAIAARARKALRDTTSTSIMDTKGSTPRYALPNEVTTLILRELRDSVMLVFRQYRAAFYLRSGPVLPMTRTLLHALNAPSIREYPGDHQNTKVRFLHPSEGLNKAKMNPQELHQLAKSHVGLFADKGLLGEEYRRLLEVAQEQQQRLQADLRISLDDLNASMQKTASTEWKEVGELWQISTDVQTGKRIDEKEAMRIYMAVAARSAQESGEDVKKIATAYADQLDTAYQLLEKEGMGSDMPAPSQ